MTWQTIIGLEVHAQLKTASKLFSGSATAFGASANSQTSFIDAGLPGVLPVLNEQALYMAILFGLATQAEINHLSFFERKNYFYPDLPKGYQISQFQRPIVSHGHLEIFLDNHQSKTVHIERAHLEEDAGKLLHDTHLTSTGIDLNRAGTALLEIVTAPCLFSAEEAVCYLKTLHQLLRFLNICDGNMQEGSFRCDVNISLRPHGQKELGTRTELKNLNSFRFIEKAIHYEQARHQEILESGQKITQETRLYCPTTETTQLLRKKEDENDYRYFPDPDLLPIEITHEQIELLRNKMPELPTDISGRLTQVDKLSTDDIDFLLTSPATVKFYDAIRSQSHAEPKLIVNWLKGTYAAALNETNQSFDFPPISSELLACLLDRIADHVIPAQLGKVIFSQLLKQPAPIDDLIAASGYQHSDDSEMEDVILAILKDFPQQVAEYQAGKDKLLSFFVGQVMKQTKGKANPNQINALLIKLLS